MMNLSAHEKCFLLSLFIPLMLGFPLPDSEVAPISPIKDSAHGKAENWNSLARGKRSEVETKDKTYEMLDYELLKELTDQHLERNGGDLDRVLSDEDYKTISEQYAERKKNKHVEHETPTPPRFTTDRVGSRQSTRPTYTPLTDRVGSRQSTRPTYTPPTEIVPAFSTDRYQTWTRLPTQNVGSTRTTENGGQQGSSQGHFNWTVASKSGHMVHVVVYFDK